ncbi:OLC1v1030587C2 [Oldenlandia corymbosa var. corymbosa]|uniref:OLC1v1030587C2 n=1 Tax=Oldenlandia corymbosa var. corymbosa TaxID=529605 RepID=A0AAV1CHA1_OLDCO|nr:OLC1v1030587C2 [Oldenlandia corymbosa var. corymbosa]
MSSKKEEERNEKIIRGLMKLPPNRRCINCNSMGPQYVCTNFWTFVCMTCSGIHREFTHRVKSVSMAKFTSQEVEALQKGGNQRAREIYFKLWDPQRHRFPDNSNADKVRELIKNVYLEKKYVGGSSSDRPPRDLQNSRSHDEEIRRASSYHSYSQSPPYDFQYEERRYGKHAPVLSRKPGSDRGLYEGKVSSFLSPSRLRDHSPGRLSDPVYEDSFALERSDSRTSDYSASSGGDPFRSNIQSPNSQRDFGSPTNEFSRDHSSEDIVRFTKNSNTGSPARRSFGRMLYPQRTASLGSFGSVDSLSFKSVNSVGLVDATNGHEQVVEPHEDKKFTAPPQTSVIGSSDGLDLFNASVAQDAMSTLPQTSNSRAFGGLDLFNAPFAQQSVSSSTVAGNVSQSPGSSSIEFSNLIQASTAPTASTNQHAQPSSSSSLDQFPKASSEPSAVNFIDEPLHFIPQNEGWATFDTPQNVVPFATASSYTSEAPASDANTAKNFDPLLSVGQWPSFKDTSMHETSVQLPQWNADVGSVGIIPSASSSESWNAFENSFGNLGERTEQVAVHRSPFSDQYLPIESKEEHGGAFKSTNPFDLPYDAGTNSEDMPQFFELSTLQAALPIVQAPSPFTAGANQHWFSEDTVAPYVQTGSEGVLGYIAGHAQSSQISNVSSHGSVASVGGNPFA